MITAHDMVVNAPGLPMHTAASAVPLIERILLVTLFATMLLSSVAFIEPSPQDGMIAVLLIVFTVAREKIERKVTCLLLLLVLWNVAGLVTLMNASDGAPWPYEKSIQYSLTTLYMSVTAILFACLFIRNTMDRLVALRAGYIASAVVAASAGISGYFHFFSGAETFLYFGRAVGMFKDPNVYAPYLIWPSLFVMSQLFSRSVCVRDVCILGIILCGIFLSFSRGAWGHLIFSAAVMVVLMVLTAPDARQRYRIVAIAVASLIGTAILLALLISVQSVHDMFLIRAQAIQDYDAGEHGRFSLQQLALNAVLDHPLGLGPFEFSRRYGQQSHNVYIQAFVVYGWVGGAFYVLMLLASFMIGLRAVFIKTPWQHYLITAFAAFAGELAEGLIVDTDHWRHFYLLVGMVWGLSAATTNHVRVNGVCRGARWRNAT